MQRNYKLNQRLLASVLLVSLFLQSCLNSPILPISTNSSQQASNEQGSIKEQPLGAGSYKQEQAVRGTSIPITVRKDLLVTADKLQIDQRTKATTGSSIQQSSTSSTRRRSDKPTVKKSVQEKGTKTAISAGINQLSPIKTQLNRRSIWKFKTRQGQRVKIYQQGEKWQANVKEKIGTFTRQHTLPVYFGPSMTLEKLASLPKLVQEQYIQFVLPKRAVNQQGYIYIGKGGLLGGMLRKSKNPKSREKEATKPKAKNRLNEETETLLPDEIELIEQNIENNLDELKKIPIEKLLQWTPPKSPNMLWYVSFFFRTEYNPTCS